MRHGTHRTGVFTRRALLVMGGQVAVLGGVAARLYQVQVVEGGRYATLAEENRISARLIAPPRGRMLDRFGIVLAGNKLNWRALLIAEQTTDLARRSTTSPASCRSPITSARASTARCIAIAASFRSWCANS